MSTRLTAITLPTGDDPGLADWGRLSVEDMVRRYRDYAERMKRNAEQILAAEDAAFRIETYLGPAAQRNREVLQAGTPKPPPERRSRE